MDDGGTSRSLPARAADALVPVRLGPGFRLLAVSSWARYLAGGISIAAAPLLVASQTDEAFLIALGAALNWIPSLLLGLLAGVVADRTDRRRVTAVSNGLRVVILAGLVTALATGTGGVTLTLVVLGLLATAEVFGSTSNQTLTPMLVAPADLAVANARVQGGFVLLAQLAGPAVGAALFASGRAWPFVSEAVLLVAATLLVLRIVMPARPADRVPGHPLHELAEGIRWTLRQPAVRTLVLTVLALNLAIGADFSILVLYAREQLGLGPIGFGLLTTVMACGSLLGTVLYGPITRRVSLGNLMRIGLVIETGMHAVLALTTAPWLAAVTFFLFGIHEFVWGTTALTVQQRLVPHELLGRVAGVNRLFTFGGLVLGSQVGGVLASRYGVTAPFWYAFVAAAVFVALLWRQLSRIRVDDEPAGTPAAAGDLASPGTTG